MRRVLTNVLPSLESPPLAERQAADTGPSTQSEHDRWLAGWACMNTLECVQPSQDAASQPGALRVAAWNLERCKHVEASAHALKERQVDLVLATEMDWGCARSLQRHTTADLAQQLGMGYVFGVEFVELAIGDARETFFYAGVENRHGFHGNAVLSRFPIVQAALIPLDEGGLWFVSDLKQGQRRVGGRNAIAAKLDTPLGSISAVAVHFESESTPLMRAAQSQRLLDAVNELAGIDPVIVGGDFNVFELSRQRLDDVAMFAAPETVEPSFAAFREAGFAWETANAPGTTTRPHPWQPEDKLRLKIDWLFVRGFSASDPWIDPAVASDGTVISDHDAIGVTLAPGLRPGGH
ncbi:ElsH Metal-dependent hydrolase [Rhabdaerophilaceae bacterium]